MRSNRLHREAFRRRCNGLASAPTGAAWRADSQAGNAVGFDGSIIQPEGLTDTRTPRDQRSQQHAQEQRVVRERLARLTPRERQVFERIVSDRPNKDIARELEISPRTVEHHRERVMSKMQAASFSELIIMAVLCGIRELRLSSSDLPPSAR